MYNTQRHERYRKAIILNVVVVSRLEVLR